MTALIIIAAILLIVLILLAQWVTLIIKYTDTLTCIAKIAFIKIDLKKLPRKKKKKQKSKKERKAPDSKEEEKEKKEKAKKDSASPTAIFEVLSIAKDLLPAFAGKLHLKASKLHARIGGKDAAAAALACAGAKAAASLLFELIDNCCRLEGRPAESVIIEPDFTSEKSAFDIDLRFRIRICSILSLGISLLAKLIKKKINDEKTKLKQYF